jgi:hypothetical protein
MWGLGHWAPASFQQRTIPDQRHRKIHKPVVNNQDHKKEKVMKYEKPEITMTEQAVQAIQTVTKMGQHFDTQPSNAAYRSDE